MPQLWEETDNVVMTNNEFNGFRDACRSANQWINTALRLCNKANQDNIYGQSISQLEEAKESVAYALSNGVAEHNWAKE